MAPSSLFTQSNKEKPKLNQKAAVLLVGGVRVEKSGLPEKILIEQVIDTCSGDGKQNSTLVPRLCLITDQ